MRQRPSCLGEYALDVGRNPRPNICPRHSWPFAFDGCNGCPWIKPPGLRCPANQLAYLHVCLLCWADLYDVFGGDDQIQGWSSVRVRSSTISVTLCIALLKRRLSRLMNDEIGRQPEYRLPCTEYCDDISDPTTLSIEMLLTRRYTCRLKVLQACSPTCPNFGHYFSAVTDLNGSITCGWPRASGNLPYVWRMKTHFLGCWGSVRYQLSLPAWQGR